MEFPKTVSQNADHIPPSDPLLSWIAPSGIWLATTAKSLFIYFYILLSFIL